MKSMLSLAGITLYCKIYYCSWSPFQFCAVVTKSYCYF